MDAQEQLMIQIWLESLRAKLQAGEVDEVIEELNIALTRIEEDQAPTPDVPPLKA